MNEVKRSIFKQRVYAKRYEVVRIDSITRYMCSYGDESYKIKTTHYHEMIKEETLTEINITMPMLEIGSKFYIEEKDLNMLVEITGTYRTSKDAVVYYIEPILIEDEETATSLKKCEDVISNHTKQKEVIKSLEDNLKIQLEDYNNLWNLDWDRKGRLKLIESKWWYKLFYGFDSELRMKMGWY